MSNEKMTQKDYLRKYLSSGADVKKKKKKKPKVGAKTVKIIDDDLDLKNMRPIEDGEFDILNAYAEDAPQIVGVVDERGPVDFTDKRRWKIIAEDGDGNVAVSSNEHRLRDVDDESFAENIKRSKKSRESNKLDREDLDPRRKIRNNSDKDISPPRGSKGKQHGRDASKTSDESDSSPPRKSRSKNKKSKQRRKDSTSESGSSLSSSNRDASPPRRSKRGEERKKSQNGKRGVINRADDSDLSPPREPKKRRDFGTNIDGNSKRQRDEKSRARRDSDGDLSPPRRYNNDQRSVEARRTSRKGEGSDSDLSPPRLASKKQHHGDGRRDSRPGRRDDGRNDRQRHRGREDSDVRSGPPDKYRRGSRSPRRKSRWNDERGRKSTSAEPTSRDGDSRMKKTLDGKTAGLQDARALRIETEAHKKREAALFNKMSADVSGVGQAAVLRDRKTGRRRDLAAEATERREKEKRQEEIDEKYAKWGKGLKQVEDQEDKRERDLYEMSKPLARYADDADLDTCRKEEMHAEDPMMEEIMERQIKEGTRKPERPSYQGSHMPNRFGIKPGHRWDGVDRSNGYEKRWFEARNARTAIQEEAYKWSTADM